MKEVVNKVSFYEHNNVIGFSVTSNGNSAKDWLKHYKKRHIWLDECAKFYLQSADFKPTVGVTTNIVVLNSALYKPPVTIQRIRTFAAKRKLTLPNPETAYLIRDLISSKALKKQMGIFQLIIMHEPIRIPHEALGNKGNLVVLLGMDINDSPPFLQSYYGYNDVEWKVPTGFVFAKE